MKNSEKKKEKEENIPNPQNRNCMCMFTGALLQKYIQMTETGTFLKMGFIWSLIVIYKI